MTTMAAAAVVVGILLCFVASSGAGSSFSSSGVPCYLHPSADGCHYTPRPDSDNCSTPAQRESMSKRIAIVNRTLAALELQLIRLGVIPPDNACSKLPSVDNGGVIYDDLNLAPGATGRYTCFEGYTLVSLDDEERYEYICTEDGIWDGDMTIVPVKCQLSSEKCSPPVDIANGTMVYLGNDSSNTLVGDMVTYSCLPGHEMVGVAQRFCLRTGNWSGEDPVCIQSGVHDNSLITGGGSKLGLILGSSLGSVVAVVTVVIVMVTIISVVVYRRRKLKNRVYREERLTTDTIEHYQSFDNPSDETRNLFGDSSEHAVGGNTSSTPHAGSQWQSSLQLLKDTAVSVSAKRSERKAESRHRPFTSSSHVVVIKDDAEASL